MKVGDHLEPAALHYTGQAPDGLDTARALVSIAISLKRIADVLECATADARNSAALREIWEGSPR